MIFIAFLCTIACAYKVSRHFVHFATCSGSIFIWMFCSLIDFCSTLLFSKRLRINQVFIYSCFDCRRMACILWLSEKFCGPLFLVFLHLLFTMGRGIAMNREYVPLARIHTQWLACSDNPFAWRSPQKRWTNTTRLQHKHAHAITYALFTHSLTRNHSHTHARTHFTHIS